VELLIARNPDPDSTLPFLLRVPVAGGGRGGTDDLVLRTKGTWPRTGALYCHPVDAQEWPAEPEIVERIPLKACTRRGAAIDLVADRRREQRSQIVFTRGRGREMVFWQSPRTRRQARPDVRVPTARAAGVERLQILVDANERYPYTFPDQQADTSRRGLACGDYAVLDPSDADGNRVVAAVERKSLADLVTSLTNGRLRFALAELATLPRAAVVVEDRYSQVFALDRVRPALVADGLAELQVRYPGIPIVFCETRKLAQEWTYRYLAAAQVWADTEPAARARLAGGSADSPSDPEPSAAGGAPAGARPGPTTAQVRAWAREQGLSVPERGRLRPEVHQAWREAHPADE
jgi:hypothetical protein